MSDSQKLLMVVALQLGLYGLGWAGAALYLRETRTAFRDMLGFSFATAVGVAFLAARGLMPDVPSRTAANLCVILGVILLWRGVTGMWNLRVSPIALYAVPGFGMVMIAWLGFVLGNTPERIGVFFMTIAWIAILSPISCFDGARKEFGRLPAWLLVVCGASVGLALSVRTAHAWWTGATSELDLSQPGSFTPIVILLAAIALANFALGYGVIARMVRRLDHLSRHDALTGLLNRRALMESIDQEWQRNRRHTTPFAVLGLDIDFFKRINDRHGHATGDEVLRRMGAVFTQTLRRTDRVGRTGGEEFIVMLVNTEREPALAFAERLRVAIAQSPWPECLHAQGGVTVSIGVAATAATDRSVPDLLARTDAALYRAKESGRNRVVEADTISALLHT